MYYVNQRKVSLQNRRLRKGFQNQITPPPLYANQYIENHKTRYLQICFHFKHNGDPYSCLIDFIDKETYKIFSGDETGSLSSR